MPAAWSAPIHYLVTFTVESIGPILGGSDLIDPPFLGRQYYANFQVDDSVLATDGPSNAGAPEHLFAQIGSSIWSQDFPSELIGMRGPCYGPITCTDEQFAIWGLGSKYLGFDVVNGVVVGLWGGLVGPGDATFVDFDGTRFVSQAIFRTRDNLPAGIASAYMQGDLSIRPVPEPGTVAVILLLLALIRFPQPSRIRGS